MTYSFGDVILAEITFVERNESKKRPAVVLFEELGNVVVAGITSNLKMKGISVSRVEGAVRESVIKTNYIFTIDPSIIVRKLFSLTEEKREILCAELKGKICGYS